MFIMEKFNIDFDQLKIDQLGIVFKDIEKQAKIMEEIYGYSKFRFLPIGEAPTEYKGKKCGTLGDISCFSFHPRKIITTGEGGMICTNNNRLAEKARALRDHGLRNQKRPRYG